MTTRFILRNVAPDDLILAARDLMAQQYSLRLPTLTECRKAFEMSQGSTFDWPEELGDDEKAAWLKQKSADKDKPRY